MCHEYIVVVSMDRREYAVDCSQVVHSMAHNKTPQRFALGILDRFWCEPIMVLFLRSQISLVDMRSGSDIFCPRTQSK